MQLFGGRGVGSGKSLRNYYLSKIRNAKARNIIDQLYRPGAKYGDGGTADALNLHEYNIQTLWNGKRI